MKDLHNFYHVFDITPDLLERIKKMLVMFNDNYNFYHCEALYKDFDAETFWSLEELVDTRMWFPIYVEEDQITGDRGITIVFGHKKAFLYAPTFVAADLEKIISSL